MTNLLAVLFSVYAALAPAKVHVDGAGYMRFIRDGRVVYAKTATFINLNGSLGSEGAKILPEIAVPADATAITVDLQGNVDAGSAHLGRLVLAIFPAGTTSSTTDSFFTFSERPTLTNPGEDAAGVIRVDGEVASTLKIVKTRPPTPSGLLTNHSNPTTTSTTQAKPPKVSVGGQVEILVRQHSEVIGGAFTVGDIASVTGPDDLVEAYKKVKIGDTAIAGVNRIIDQRYVTLKLRGAGHVEGSYVLVVPPGADVGRKTKTVSAEDITNLAIKAAQEKIGAKIDFRVNGVVHPIIADDGDIVLETSDPDQTSKGYLVTVTARIGNTIVGTQMVTLVPPAQLGDVKVGDSVKVILKAGAAVIEVEGRALTAGFVGQKIKVSITASANSGNGKTTTHTGTVIEAGKVEVDL